VRRVSKKRAKTNKEADEWRAEFKDSVGRCEYCLKKAAGSSLDADEISRGCCRKISLMAPYAILVLHRHCHNHCQNMSRAKRLAILMLARPEAYDLELFWQLTRRRWPDQEDVDREAEALLRERLANGISLQHRSSPARQDQ